MNRLFDFANKTVNYGTNLFNQINGRDGYIRTINSFIKKLKQEKLALKKKQSEEIAAPAKILKDKEDEIALLKNRNLL